MKVLVWVVLVICTLALVVIVSTAVSATYCVNTTVSGELMFRTLDECACDRPAICAPVNTDLFDILTHPFLGWELYKDFIIPTIVVFSLFGISVGFLRKGYSEQ